MPNQPKTLTVIGNGRAGGALVAALDAIGWPVDAVLGRSDDYSDACNDTDIVVIAAPDDALATVAARIEPGNGVVMHLSGSRTLDVLAPHERRASMHPLMSLPDPVRGAKRLLDNCAFAVCGDPVAELLVQALGGRGFAVDDDDRASYHAAASIAANHVVTLCAQVERVAGNIGAPADAFWRLISTSVENASQLGASAALTGPAARGDWDTIAAHLSSLPPDEQVLYRAVAKAAAELANQQWPSRLD